MKHLLFAALLSIFAILPMNANQVMTMTNGEEIEVLIEVIGSTEISYKKASNPQGPTYAVERSKVFFILYEDGTKEIITPLNQANQPQSSNNNETANSNAENNWSNVGEVAPERVYFKKTFYPRAAIGCHGTFSGMDEIDLEWGGLYWAFDLNMLFPTGNRSAWSAGLGLVGLSGTMKARYTQGGENHKSELGDYSTMYLTIPVQYWMKGSDLVTVGCGIRSEILISQKCNGESVSDAFKGFRESLMGDLVFSVGQLDLGVELLLNLVSALKGEGLDWSPTIGFNVNVGYRF